MAKQKSASRYYNDITMVKRKHGASGKHVKSQSKFEHAHFIAIDGEGIDIPDVEPLIVYDENGVETERVVKQSYALLMSNEGKYVIDEKGLSTTACIEFLMNCTDDPRAILVCFGASYDANMMLRSIPRYLLRRLHKGYTIDWNKYQISYRPRKELTIREYADVSHKFVEDVKGGKGKLKGVYKKSVTMWDVFGFFQGSFVDTLHKYFVKGNTDKEEAERYKQIIKDIEAGKKLRGTFTELQLSSFVMPYCKLEVDALNHLMRKLQRYLHDIGIVITRWDGAGACAAAALAKYGIKEHIDLSNTQYGIIEASEYAFYGGRIETLQYGNYEEDVYHYDINSAYPSALIDLPSMSHGTWRHEVYADTDDDFRRSYFDRLHAGLVTCYLMSWTKLECLDETVIAPFPWRSKQNYVFFPPEGIGWVWGPEVNMAYDTFDKDDWAFHIHEAWYYTPDVPDYRPFSFIKELYELRKKFVQEQNGAEKVIKLILNSLYGKMAQSVGYNKETDTKPPYHNLIVAGMITSMTRAKMMRAAMQKPNDIIMLATDGIYARSPLQVLGVGSKEKRLGEWEAEIHEYMTVILSGVYFYKSEDAKENAFSRGFDRYTVLRDEVVEAWKRGEKVLKAKTTRFVGLGAALATRWEYWCTWRTIDRELGLDMTTVAKRNDNTTCHIKACDGLKTTFASRASLYSHYHPDRYPYNPYKYGDKHPLLSSKFSFEWDEDMLDGVRMREYLEEAANTTA